MLRKIRKLILHPNRYFYDYFRKKLGFRKFFVTDKIRLLDSENHQKWHKVLFSHPYLYLYYKFNKRLRKPAYPILVDYRIENIDKSGMGGGKRQVLAVELERQNTIYFADPEIVQKALENKEPYLVGKILKFSFQGSSNKILIDAGVKFARAFHANFIGNNNNLMLGPDCRMRGGLLNFQGASNTINLGRDCIFNANANVIFNGDGNTVETSNEISFLPGLRIIFNNNYNFIEFGSQSNIADTLFIFRGSTNNIKFGTSCVTMPGVKIIFDGEGNIVNIKNGCKVQSNSRIVFSKNNNYLYIGDEARFSSSAFHFHGDSSVAYICRNASVNNTLGIRTQNIFFYGLGSTSNGFKARLLENKNILIGSDCMFSWRINLTNSNDHAIYDGNTKQRILKGDSIIIGDHVWIGEDAVIYKGTKVKSGSIIGRGSLVSGKEVPSGCIYAGVPAKVIKENILWTRKGSTGDLTIESIKTYDTYQEPDNKPDPIGWDNLLKINLINPALSATEKVTLIKQIINDRE